VVDNELSQHVRSHLRFGWTGLLVWILLGTGLEGLHAWKAQLYLGPGNDTRRLLWTLAHAHGIGLSLVQLGFAATLGFAFPRETPVPLPLAARLLNWASVFIPLGFLLGGITTYEADPGLGVLLVPIGALLLIGAVCCVLFALTRKP
jgi:hypothetical protein